MVLAAESLATGLLARRTGPGTTFLVAGMAAAVSD